jgi:formamidopyrimidine-DNA glycosylase
VPELPEVETVVRSLRRRLGGARVESVRCYYPATVGMEVESVDSALRGKTFAGFSRHGKYIFLVMAGGGALAIHLRMTGQLFLADKARLPDKHTHVEILLAGAERKLVFRDVRKFGRLFVAQEGVEAFVRSKGLGPDALKVSPDQLRERFARTRRCVKATLLDQSVIAGLGNIYTDEVLFRTRVAPLRRADSLSEREVGAVCENIREVLYAAIAARGTTISDYVDLEGEQGGFQFSLQVYGRAGLECRRCGAAVRRVVAAGRGTWYCPSCQG